MSEIKELEARLAALKELEKHEEMDKLQADVTDYVDGKVTVCRSSSEKSDYVVLYSNEVGPSGKDYDRKCLMLLFSRSEWDNFKVMHELLNLPGEQEINALATLEETRKQVDRWLAPLEDSNPWPATS